MRRIASLLVCLASIPAFAQTDALNGFCTQGGKSVTTQGLVSTNKAQIIIPKCQVDVYLTGTLTHAVIYKDALNTPLSNPFTADDSSAVAPGRWSFFALDGQGYDVVMSGGGPPLTFTAPVTLVDLKVGSGGPSYAIQVNGVPLLAQPPANFVNSATVTFSNPTGNQVQATAVSAGGGCAGTVPGDNTSTNCGYQNLNPPTTAMPPNYATTFGYQNFLGSTIENGDSTYTAFGTSNGQNGNADNVGGAVNWAFLGNSNGIGVNSPEIIGIGDSNLQYPFYGAPYVGLISDAIAIGDQNAVGTSGSPCSVWSTVFIGKKNANPCAANQSGGEAQDLVGIGDTNFLFNNSTTLDVYVGGLVAVGQQNIYDVGGMSGITENISNSVAIGGFNINGLGGTTGAGGISNSANIVSIGDFNTYVTGPGSQVYGNIEDIVNIGDTNANFLLDGDRDIVAVGDENYSNTYTAATPAQFVAALGFSNANLGGGHDIVAIGDSSLANNTAAHGYSSGSEIVAIGDEACTLNTTGSDNICIGDQAGNPSYTTHIGNTTGSHNIYIGDAAGPTGTSTGFSNVIDIGYNAQNSASNSIVIGNSSMTSIALYGCSAGQYVKGDGSGCGAGGASSPLTTKGDIWVYGSSDTRLPVGTNGFVLSANSAQATGLQWVSALANPMTTLGDIIYGGASGTATRLAGNTTASTLCLVQTGTGSVSAAPSWAACSGSTATALSSVTAASATATINSNNNPITWNWAQTTNSQTAFTLGENTAASGTSDHMVDVKTLAGSTAIPLTISDSLNGAQAIAALQVLPTWNTSGVVDAAILVNVTNTASGTASKLLDLQVGGTSKLAVDKTGIVTNATWNGVAIANAFLANPATTVNSQTCTLGATCSVNLNNAATFNNSGSGAASGTTFDGSAARTISYNTLGAAPTASPTFTGTMTTPITGSTQCLHVNSSGVISGTGADCGAGSSITLTTTGTSGLATLVTGTLNIPHYAGSGSNSDITSLTGLTTPLSVPQGGSGAATLTGYLKGNGTSAFTASATVPGSDVSGNIPGNAANLYGTPALPNGTTATTQAAGDNSTKLATTAYVANPGAISPTSITMSGTTHYATIGGMTFAALTAAVACNAGNTGTIATVTDSTTTTWGAVISGSGANTVLAFCDGSAYTVAGK